MSKVENTKDLARLQKFFESSKAPQCTVLIKENGTKTNSNREVIETLMKKHFPDCRMSNTDIFVEPNHNHQDYEEDNLIEIDEAINLERITWAIRSFSPFKTPGKD